MTDAQVPSRRLFFALWPGDELRAGIAERRDRLGAISRRRVPDHNLHLTLVFLGDQPGNLLPGVVEQAGQVAGTPFRLTLDRAGWFARAGVVWLGGPAVDEGRELVRELTARMGDLGIEPDRRPWAPHVTLFRQVRRCPALPGIAPLDWPAREFSLIESIPGRPYQVLRTWPLDS